MATRVNNGDINWDGNWQTVGVVNVLHASTNLVVDSGQTRYSAYWAGNASNTDLGALAYMASENDAGTLTVTLESADDTAFTVNLASETSTTLVVDSNTKAATWFFFKYAATIAENAAKYYRVKFTSNNTADINFRSNNADTSKVAIIQVLNATSTLAAGDVTYVVGTTQASTGNPTAQTVTVNINSTTGYGILTVCNGGTLLFPDGSTTKLTVTGTNIYVFNGGLISMGTVASPITSNYTSDIVFNPPSNGNFWVDAGGSLIMQGASKTFYKTSLSSAISAGAKSFVTTDTTGWVVGDEIVITTTTTTKAQTEKVTITGISGTTIYIDSNGDGSGASPSFTYAHATRALVLNISRNVKISTTGSYNCYVRAYGLDCDWASFKALRGGYAQVSSEWNSSMTIGNLSYCVFREGTAAGITRTNGNNNGETHTITHCISYANSGKGFDFFAASPSATYSDWFAINNGGQGIGISYCAYSAASITTLSNMFAIANTNDGVNLNTGVNGQLLTLTGGLSAYNDRRGFLTATGIYYFYSVQTYGNGWMGIACGAYNVCSIIRDWNSIHGQDGVTQISNSGGDIGVGDTSYSNSLLDYAGVNVILGSTNKTYNLSSSQTNIKSCVKVSNIGQIAGRHYSTFRFGQILDQITNGQTAAYAKGGSGICVALNPTSQTSPLQWEFYVPVTAATQFTLKAYLTKTTSGFNGSVKVTIFDSDDDMTRLLDQETISNASIPLNDGSGDDWTYQYSATPVTPTNTGFCRVLVEVLDGSTTGDILVDSVSVT